ncbi:MAG: hypothetical protein WBA67_07910 [Jannaschia sp.]
MTDHNHTQGAYTESTGSSAKLVFILLGGVALVLLLLMLFSGGEQGVEIIPGAETIEQNGTVNVPVPTEAPVQE